ncbi:MAG: anti-sigma factor [Actinomycetia bacterium]|nr:anti-sigma factor [Actinomycetes bacterium]
MSPDRETEDLHLLSGAYALDALDDLERVRFEKHLRGCESCAAEVAELSDVAAELGSAQRVKAPDSLRTAVLAEVTRTPQQVPVVPRESTDSRPVTRYVGYAVAAVALVVAGIGIGQVVAVNDTQPELVAESSELVALATAPDTQVVRSSNDNGRFAYLVSQESNRAVMVGEGVQTPGNERTYQMWLLDAQGDAISMGVFEPNSTGEVVLPMEGDLAGAQGFAVTVEPSGGSQVATTDPIDVVQLA